MYRVGDLSGAGGSCVSKANEILGPVTIGDNVVVGANAVVVNDIPAGSVAVGVLVRVIKSGVLLVDYL